jgi:uncharacterized YccA/Bax inhibitor family protein
MSRVLLPLSYRATAITVPVRQAAFVVVTGMMRAMHLATAAILGLGESISSFGQTLALVLTFVVVVGGLAQILIGYAVAQVMVERKQNIARRKAYDAAHDQ